jgi:putative peptidoglycan lipid II flippase
MKLFRASAVVGGFTLASRLLGFLRDMLMAAVLGAGPVADAFFAAFRLPNLFRRMFAEGAFNAAFIPLYAGKLQMGQEEEADAFAREALATLISIVLVLVLIFEASMPFVMQVVAKGFTDKPELFAKAVLYAQITMPYILFMSVTALLGGVLNARGRFAAAAAAPIMLNIVLISFLLSGTHGPHETAIRLSIGVALSGILQAAVVIWGCRNAGLKLFLRPPSLSPDVKRLLALSVPGAIAGGVVQINLVVGQRFASQQEHAISWLQYADRLYQLPLGLVGVAMGVALLPALSRLIKADEMKNASHTLNQALELSALFTLPAAFALAALPDFFVEGVFMRGEFSPQDAFNTGQALRVYAAGLPSFILIKVFSPGYFARENTKTPMQFAAIGMVINVALCAILFPRMGFVGLAWATSISGWANAVFLGIGLARSGFFAPSGKLLWRLARLLLASIVMAGFVRWAAYPLRDFLSFLPFYYLFAALLVAGLGMVVYAVAALVLGAVQISRVKSMLRRS